MVRRLLVLSFGLGCAVSVLASGRFTPRLIADGMVSFAFVPLAEIAGFAVSRRLLSRRERFSLDADQFLHGNWPWLVWILGVVAFTSLAATVQTFEVFNLLLLFAILPIAASIRLDYRFFHHDRGAGRLRAVAAVFAQRAIAWPLAVIYFLGMAVPIRDFLYTFVELRDQLANSIRSLL
jgi:hypothetical protein